MSRPAPQVLSPRTDPAPLASAAGTLTLDLARILGRLQAAAAATGTANDLYLAACGALQVQADLAQAARLTDQPAAVRAQTSAMARKAEAAAEAAAEALVSPLPSNAPSSNLPSGSIKLSGALGGRQPLLDKILALPQPECCGYDLGDLETAVTDARWLAATLGDPHARLVLLGVRGGGSVLAPLWAVALRAAGQRDVSWTTVRPAGEASARQGYDPAELEVLADRDGAADRPRVVILDDQPDTGDSIAQLARHIPSGAEVWFASLGRVSRLDADGRRRQARARSPLRPAGHDRLWERLLAEDHPAFLDRLSANLPLPLASARVEIRAPTLPARYGQVAPWLPWNSPALADQRRRLINPRKTPVTVVDAAGRPLLHLRFVGEGPFGRAEHDRVVERFDLGPTWFVDGYHVTPHVESARVLREALAEASRPVAEQLLDQSAAWLAGVIVEPRATADGLADRRDTGAGLRRRLAQLEERLGVNGRLPEAVGWMADSRTPLFGRTGRALCSALPYAYGFWHWRVDPNGRVRRFHLDATWGGVTWPELEAAAFALEHRLSRAQLAFVVERLDLGRDAVEAVVESLPAACLLMLDALHRGLRTVSDAGRRRLDQDLADTWATAARLAKPH